MSLRNYELEHHFSSLSLPVLPVQEAILDEQMLLGLDIGSCGLFVQNFVEGGPECFTWRPQVLGHLIEEGVLFLFLFPVGDISCGEPCGTSHYSLLLVSFLAAQYGLDSLLGSLFERCYGIVKYGFDPRVWDLVQVLLNLLLREAVIHPA